MRVLLIDPARLTRESLGYLLRDRAPDFRIEPLADCGAADVDQHDPPAAVLVNAKMASFADPALKKTLATLSVLWFDVPCLLMSEREDAPEAALQAILDGWRGVFPDNLGVDLLVAATRLVISGGIFIPPEIVRHCAAALCEHAVRP